MMQKLGQGLGLPNLSEIAEVLKNVPDEARLRLVRSILIEVSRMRQGPEELSLVVELVKFIAAMPQEKVVAVRDTVEGLNKLVKLLPKDGLTGLPLRELLEELKK